MKIWAYYRVSSDFQNYKSQKIGVLNWCKQKKYLLFDIMMYNKCINKERN